MHDPTVPYRVALVRRRTNHRGDVWLLLTLAVLLLAALGVSATAG